MSGEPVVCAVGLGSNLGDRRGHLDLAVREIAALPNVRLLRASRWIETDPVGGPPDQGPYLNGALLLETALPPRELLEALQSIERAHGRRRIGGRRNEPRTLDLDLLTYGALAIAEPDLAVPHPRMEEREFVLAPLSEIAPELVLPCSGRSVSEALARLAEAGGARRTACTPP
jgi:2-amino-4-hydroxy-6-hydroxymethyldihydropteridine diphosphokinase